MFARYSQKIKDSAYNKEPEQLAFNRNKAVVVMYPKEINLSHLENEAEARKVVDWLKNILNDTPEGKMSITLNIDESVFNNKEEKHIV